MRELRWPATVRILCDRRPYSVSFARGDQSDDNLFARASAILIHTAPFPDHQALIRKKDKVERGLHVGVIE